MTTHRLEPLLNPAVIAIVGASNNPTRIGGMPTQKRGTPLALICAISASTRVL